jgi:hypothetical protein
VILLLVASSTHQPRPLPRCRAALVPPSVLGVSGIGAHHSVSVYTHVQAPPCSHVSQKRIASVQRSGAKTPSAAEAIRQAILTCAGSIPLHDSCSSLLGGTACCSSLLGGTACCSSLLEASPGAIPQVDAVEFKTVYDQLVSDAGDLRSGFDSLSSNKQQLESDAVCMKSALCDQAALVEQLQVNDHCWWGRCVGAR